MEANQGDRELRFNVLLVALNTNKQELADEIGAQRTTVTKVLQGHRIGKSIRGKLADAICRRIHDLLPPDISSANPSTDAGNPSN